ncbi:unnamed protein product [Heterobilharzia americana]|nr:unnamed protein product [Heterobilharzia americana]CAH8641366.1 unnamed protein product [Heterobilharzia americana]
MKVSSSFSDFTEVDIITRESFVDQECANYMVLLGEYTNKMKSHMRILSDSLKMLKMRCSPPPKRKFLLLHRSSLVPCLSIQSEMVYRVEHLFHLGSPISHG